MVLERLFSEAMGWRRASGSHESRGGTAAGVTSNIWSAKASIWKSLSVKDPVLSQLGLPEILAGRRSQNKLSELTGSTGRGLFSVPASGAQSISPRDRALAVLRGLSIGWIHDS